ncbi:HEAT repeat domain-containing protein [bacterium]|nr:HEAT repeat domain-containing protein [bacterium]
MSVKHLSEDQTLSYALNTCNFQEMAEIESHLENCPECRARCDQAGKWAGLFGRREIFPVEEENLIRARNRLDAGLQKSPAQARKSLAAFLNIRIPSHIRTRHLAMAALLFIGGMLAGHYMRPGQTDPQTSLLAALQSGNPDFRIIRSETDPNQVEIRLRSMEEKAYRGDIRDPEIQKALAYSLISEERDNVRMQTLDMIQLASQNETTENALLNTLANDPNPGMRYRAVKLLKQFPVNDEMIDLLIRVLFQESNPGVRIQVTETLLRSGDPEVLPVLRKKAEKDEYVRYVLEAAETEKALSVSHD